MVERRLSGLCRLFFQNHRIAIWRYFVGTSLLPAGKAKPCARLAVEMALIGSGDGNSCRSASNAFCQSLKVLRVEIFGPVIGCVGVGDVLG